MIFLVNIFWGHSLHRKVSFSQDIYPCTPGYWISVERQLLLQSEPSKAIESNDFKLPMRTATLKSVARWIANWSFSFNGFGKCLGVFPLILVGRSCDFSWAAQWKEWGEGERKRQRRNNQATFPGIWDWEMENFQSKVQVICEEYGFYICSKDYPQPCLVPTPSSCLERCMQWRPVNVAFDSDTEQWKLSHSIQNAIPHYFLHKKSHTTVYIYNLFHGNNKNIFIDSSKGDRFVASFQVYYTVIFVFLEKDFPEDSIYSRGRNLHYTWVWVLNRKHIAFWSWVILDIPWKIP